MITACKVPEVVGNGYCNDEANNLHCGGFDVGDCCYSCISTLFCSDCKCLTGDAGKEINYPLIGDGYCQDETNNAECNYDGGDCCVNVKTNFCSECACYLQETCASGHIHTNGDGICNDETNNADCSFDHGDCCLSNVNTDHCSECSCSVTGVITSPGFPQNYGTNQDVTWLIQLPIQQQIEIDFVSFDVGIPGEFPPVSITFTAKSKSNRTAASFYEKWSF